jgi:hypothetical protein
LTLKAAMISATPPMTIMMPTISTAEAVAATTLPSAMTPAIMKMTPRATIQPHLARSARTPSPRLCGTGVLLVTDMVILPAEWRGCTLHAVLGPVAASMGNFGP